MDPERNALSEPDPGKRRIDRGQQVGAVAPLVIGDATRDAVHMAGDIPIVAHQTDARLGADPNVAEFGLLEVRLDPDLLEIDHGQGLRAPRQEVARTPRT